MSVPTPTIHAGEDCRTLEEGFFYIAVIQSNGKDFGVNIPENIIPILNRECIEKATELLRDAFYRMRPDLRKQ